jgi:hypothetical protein
MYHVDPSARKLRPPGQWQRELDRRRRGFRKAGPTAKRLMSKERKTEQNNGRQAGYRKRSIRNTTKASLDCSSRPKPAHLVKNIPSISPAHVRASDSI